MKEGQFLNISFSQFLNISFCQLIMLEQQTIYIPAVFIILFKIFGSRRKFCDNFLTPRSLYILTISRTVGRGGILRTAAIVCVKPEMNDSFYPETVSFNIHIYSQYY